MKDLTSRPNFLARSVAWFLVALTATASGQTNTSVRYDMPASRNPLNAYSADSVPQPDLANSPLLDQLIRDGKLYLSLKDAIRLALENNLDLAIARYNLPIAKMDILRTQAGGIFRGVNAGVVQGTPGGGVGGFGTGAPGAGAGGTTGGAGGAGAGASGLVQSTLGAGTAVSSYDPSIIVARLALSTKPRLWPISRSTVCRRCNRTPDRLASVTRRLFRQEPALPWNSTTAARPPTARSSICLRC